MLSGGAHQFHVPCTKPPSTTTSSLVGRIVLLPQAVHHTQPSAIRKCHGGTLLPGTLSKSTPAHAKIQTLAAALESVAQQPPPTTSPIQHQKGMIVKGVIEEFQPGAASILLMDGSRAKLPWESVTKRAFNYQALRHEHTSPLSVGEEILAMVRSEASGREPTRVSTAALESMPGSILEDKKAVFAEAEEWLQIADSHKPASFSAWRGERQLQRFIQPALENRAMTRKRRG
ncbi:hypothetical protein DUNSADRAFT_11236 [Dunaliella salina]|uniref:S1 motif domain-containing protein n=1 Tax=Dunaliella salina TaxID=3046 RepID=A0ABQ7GDV0_DUNSA|nr:hypothetical protein DUNSADRAFT_11236 [Dunaliella salina]|eukprot:KAF5832778.1 hypothetical protein DUNSADRAFT_11236 [Dunaliella salina]